MLRSVTLLLLIGGMMAYVPKAWELTDFAARLERFGT
jgi:hypothetical protein